VSEGTEALSLSHTPLSTANKLRVDVSGLISNAGAGRNTTITIFDGSTCLGMNSVVSPGVERPQAISHTIVYAAGSTSAKTISVRFGSEAANNVAINGDSVARLFGGASLFTLTVTEIAA
jgi:hypothetical protein